MPKITSVAGAEQAEQASSINFLVRVQRKERWKRCGEDVCPDGMESKCEETKVSRKESHLLSLPGQISEGTEWTLASPLEWIPS